MPAPRGHRDRLASREVLAGERIGVAQDVPGRALGHDLATVDAGAGTHVHHVVGRHDRFLVVLDHDHRVAQVAQALQRLDQALVVALVQPDRGLVEHVHHAGQAGADLARKADALRFAARERIRGAGEREVVEANVVQELHAVGDLAHDLLGDRLLRARQFQLLEEGLGLAQRHRGKLVDVAPGHEDVARLDAQPRALALRAGARVEVLGELFLDRDRIGFAIAPLEVRQDPLERMLLDGAAPLLARVLERDLLLAGTLQHDVLRALRERLERLVHIEAVVLRERNEHREVELVAPVPSAHGATGERQVRKSHHALGIEERDLAQAVAARAGAHRIVEREESRLELRDRVAVDGAGELGREEVLLAVVHLHRHGAPVGVAQCRLEGFGQALLQAGGHLEPVDHDLDGVLLVAVELGQAVDLVHFAVDAQPHEALCAQFVEELGLLALAPDHDRGEHHHLRALGKRQHVVDHLRDTLGGKRRSVLGAVGVAHAGEEQPQVVVDLGDRAHGGARVVRGRLLLDRDRGRQALDEIDVGLLHELEELARVSRQRFDVAPLALGIESVEGKGGFAGAGEPRDHDEAVARNVEADIPQIVRPGTADSDRFHRAIC
jgi:hypothetical protein